MLPAGQDVEAVYLGDNGLLAALPESSLVIDSSTIAPETIPMGALARDLFTLHAGQGSADLDFSSIQRLYCRE